MAKAQVGKPTIEQLQDRCDYWLRHLGMAEWMGRVKVSFKSQKFMDGTVGKCSWMAEECTADIYLLRGKGELELLHEILHLCLSGHTTYTDESYSEMHERAINRLVGCLLRGAEAQSADTVPGPALVPAAV